jgi:hypothetical protein
MSIVCVHTVQFHPANTFTYTSNTLDNIVHYVWGYDWGIKLLWFLSQCEWDYQRTLHQGDWQESKIFDVELCTVFFSLLAALKPHQQAYSADFRFQVLISIITVQQTKLYICLHIVCRTANSTRWVTLDISLNNYLQSFHVNLNGNAKLSKTEARRTATKSVDNKR